MLTGEVRRGPSHLVVGPGFAEDPRLESEVSSERRSDEADAVDGDGVSVEQGAQRP